MKLWSNYVLAATIDEAVQALARAGGSARPVAGGTDLLLELQQGRHEPVHTLVDVSAIPDLQRLEERGGQLFIGAGVPVARIVEHPLVRRHAPAVVEACGLIGGPQVRNTATLGGNVAHALPAADGMISLAAMDAVAEAASVNGTRLIPLLELFRGLGKSVLTENNEILTGFYLPLRQTGQASAFSRVMRPQGVALPIPTWRSGCSAAASASSARASRSARPAPRRNAPARWRISWPGRPIRRILRRRRSN